MLSVAAVVGFSRLLAPTSGTLERALPMWLTVVWYVLLAVGSVTGLAGVFWKEPVAGLLIERAGLFALCSSGLVYSIALIAVGGWGAVAAASFVLGFGVASAVRAIDIGRVLVKMQLLASAQNMVLDTEDRGRPKA